MAQPGKLLQLGVCGLLRPRRLWPWLLCCVALLLLVLLPRVGLLVLLPLLPGLLHRLGLRTGRGGGRSGRMQVLRRCCIARRRPCAS
jgi:hypothetical protein